MATRRVSTEHFYALGQQCRREEPLTIFIQEHNILRPVLQKYPFGHKTRLDWWEQTRVFLMRSRKKVRPYTTALICFKCLLIKRNWNILIVCYEEG